MNLLVALTWIILQEVAFGKVAFTRLERTVALNLDPWYNLDSVDK